MRIDSLFAPSDFDDGLHGGTVAAESEEVDVALASLAGKATTKMAGRPLSVRTRDIFKAPPALLLRVPLNLKTTQNARRSVAVALLEPTQESIPVDGIKAYIANTRRDPPDVLHIVTRAGRERYVIQDGHTRAAAATLRGASEIDARVWEFTEDAAGELRPVPRGLQKRGMEKAKLLRAREILLAEFDEDEHPRDDGGPSSATDGRGKRG